MKNKILLNTNIESTDSLIFDMDGTLWNATESYAKIWNVCSEKLGFSTEFTAKDLIALMGKSIDEIFLELFNGDINFERDKYLNELDLLEGEMMPNLGGILYPGVKEGIEKLSKEYKLFLLSNCGILGLKNFIKYNHFEKYFTDSITFGETKLQKSENLKILINRHNLKAPLYIGDTQGDCNETHLSGTKFVYVNYGFGKCNDADLEFDNFSNLTKYFIANKK